MSQNEKIDLTLLLIYQFVYLVPRVKVNTIYFPGRCCTAELTVSFPFWTVFRAHKSIKSFRDQRCQLQWPVLISKNSNTMIFAIAYFLVFSHLLLIIFWLSSKANPLLRGPKSIHPWISSETLKILMKTSLFIMNYIFILCQMLIKIHHWGKKCKTWPSLQILKGRMILIMYQTFVCTFMN